MFYSFHGKCPRVDPTAFVSTSAELIGDVTVGPRCYIGPGAVIRGDAAEIILEEEVAVEDGVIIHAGGADKRCLLSRRVTIGHGAIVHARYLGPEASIGMGAVLSLGCAIGAGSVVAESAGQVRSAGDARCRHPGQASAPAHAGGPRELAGHEGLVCPAHGGVPGSESFLSRCTAGGVSTMDWREIYARRLCTPEQAAALIAPGDRIFAGGAGSFPAVLIDAVSDRAELRDIPVVTVVNGTESRALSDPACFARTPYHSLFLGRADRKFQQRGGLHENSVQFHQTVRAAREVYRVNTLMLEVSEPDADGYLYYGPRGTAWSSLDTQVEKRIYQVNAFQQRTRGEHHRIHVSEVTALCRADHPLNTYHYKAPDALDARIAAHILPLVRDGDTLQVGIGGIPNAVAYGLHGRKRLGIYTEVLTQAQLRLMASGAVDLDRVEASIVLDAAGHLDDFALAHIRMIPVDVLNDPFRAAQQPGLISVNGCLMADLTGQVCAEAIDGRQYSGVGGQLDFVRAAARSVGGRSFLCLHSTHEAPDGTLTSNIRAHLPSGAVVTTPRSDVMYIVTEWGAADLHNQPLETRICAMIRIAHPRFRCALAQEAVAWGQLSPECAAQFDTQPEPEEETT